MTTAPHMQRGTILALDIGGTKVRAAVVDATGRLLDAESGVSAAQGGAQVVLHHVRQCAEAVLARHRAAHGEAPSAIGVAAAGEIDMRTARVVSATDLMPGWGGTDLRAELGGHWSLPVYAANDAHCALIGEAAAGGHATDGLTVMLTLGTGLGGAMMLDGALYIGAHGRAGHFGRLAVRPGPHLGRADDWVSGNGLVRLYGDAGVKRGEEVLHRAGAGDQRAITAVAHWVDGIVDLLATLQWMLDPARVILGGGVIASREAWWPLLLQALKTRGVDNEVRPATLGNDAGVVGAARLARQGLAEAMTS